MAIIATAVFGGSDIVALIRNPDGYDGPAMVPATLLLIFLLALAAFTVGRAKSVSAAGGHLENLHSRPAYHGLYAMLWVAIAGFGTFVVMDALGLSYVTSLMGEELAAQLKAGGREMLQIEQNLVLQDARRIAEGRVASAVDPLREYLAATFAEIDGTRVVAVCAASLGMAVLAFFMTFAKIGVAFRARNSSERILRTILLMAAGIAILTTVGILLSLIGETLNFTIGVLDWRIDKFLFGTTWSPLSGVHSGDMDPDKVGAVPLFVGTFMITIIAMLVAVPVGLFAAIYLSDFASKSVRAWAKPMLEILAGIPTVVYGFFAAITVAPAIRDAGAWMGVDVAAQSALAAGVVMGVMIIPFISSLSDDVINAVPQSLRDGSYGLGATKAETIRQVVLPAALPGIVSAVLLGISRAVGETMIVVMAAGQGANLTINPLEEVTTVTVQIVMLILGDTDAATAAGPAYTLGFTLFVITLALNLVALRIVRKYREAYD
ncbi:phosphate ABC transporter permease subunit PstC [Paralimibaculum aggregatum]|uniref:Phosphate transport system permease protein n=1 Tax=Paralimibaculum aggregatum TaxID=3036245 RepID=A0ABQ6LEH1_9RHOB|nr:phosphate ABC transporter permease subunit PstC [Limibaculum sp. NKW23]